MYAQTIGELFSSFLGISGSGSVPPESGNNIPLELPGSGDNTPYTLPANPLEALLDKITDVRAYVAGLIKKINDGEPLSPQEENALAYLDAEGKLEVYQRQIRESAVLHKYGINR